MTARHDPIAGRVPAHDLEAEAAVLSAVLLKRGALAEVSDVLAPKHFYSEANGRIFGAALALDAEGKPIDAVTVASWLRDREQLQRVGGPGYLMDVCDATPAVANVRAHAVTVVEKARIRAMVDLCHGIAAEGYGDVGDVGEWLDSVESRICAVADEGRVDEDAPELPGPIITRIFESFRAEETGDAGQVVRIPTGLPDLDKLLKGGGLALGGVTTTGAYWGVGKTSLALEIAGRVATSDHRGPRRTNDRGETIEGTRTGVAVFSLEMPRDELLERALAQAARVDVSKGKREWTGDEWSEVTNAANLLSRSPLWTDDRPDHTPTTIRARLRRMKAEAARLGVEIRLVVCDYLQLMNGKGGVSARASREEEVAYLARSMKLLARSEKVHVIVVGQLNDDANKRSGDKRPRSADFRESKAIPMNADNCILIHNPFARARALARRDGDDAQKAPEAEVAELILDKQRGGRTGSVRVLFEPAFTSFRRYDGRAYNEEQGS